MTSTLYLQSGDPTQPRLLDQLVEGAIHADRAVGMFAWTTASGVDSVLGHPEIQKLCARGGFSLVVGVDTITTPAALARLDVYETRLAGLSVKVFLNPVSGLFHPKVVVYENSKTTRVIAGSGNLTTGGLANNWEAFSDVDLPTSDWLPQAPLSVVEAWISQHVADLVSVTDQRAVDAATRNQAQFAKLRSAETGPQARSSSGQSGAGSGIATSSLGPDPVLISEIPKNRGDKSKQIPPGYSQANFTKQIFHSFFGYRPGTLNTVLNWNIDANGSISNAESTVTRYKQASDNYYFELGAARGRPYPSAAGARPIVAFRKIGNGEYLYFVAAPGDPGYQELLAILLAISPAVTTRMRRVEIDSDELAKRWPGSPLN